MQVTNLQVTKDEYHSMIDSIEENLLAAAAGAWHRDTAENLLIW